MITRWSEESLHEINKKADSILLCAFLMILGLIFLKYIPMFIYGKDILSDASAHLTITFFVLYVVWNFVDNKKFKQIFFILAFFVLIFVSYQRVLVGAHNTIGLLLGTIVSLISISLSNCLTNRNLYSSKSSQRLSRRPLKK